MDATILHYPPPHNPNYERERDDYSVALFEHELACAQHEADCHELRAGDLYYDGHLDDANWHYDRMDAANRRVAEIRDRLRDLEGF